MTDFNAETQPLMPEEMQVVQVGELLTGLVVDKEQRPDGVEYWDQVIPSPFGDLYYAPDQVRNGTLGWVTNHGEVRITVESGSGTVLAVDTEAKDKHFVGYSAHIYQMGIDAYQESRRKLLEEYPYTKG